MYKFIFLLIFISTISLQAEGQDIEVSSVQAEYHADKAHQESYLIPYAPPKLTYSYKEPRKFRVYAQSLLGTLKYKVNMLTFESGKNYILQKQCSDWLNSITNEKKFDKAYGRGFFSLQNVGVSLHDSLSFCLGYYKSHSKVKLENKRAVDGNRQLILHLQEKTDTEGLLTSLYWNMPNISTLKWLGCQPYVGIGAGVTRTQRNFKGYADESEKETFGLRSFFQKSNPTIRYLIDNRVESSELPFIFDLGFDIGTNPIHSPVFDVSLGFRLYEVKSTLTRSSFYTGLKLTF